MSSKTGYPSIDKTHLKGIPEEMLHPEILPLSIMTVFQKVNEGHMDEVAVDTIAQQYTKQEVLEQAYHVARALLGSGVRTGETIALMMPNCIEGIILTIAANAIGVNVAYLEPFRGADYVAEEIELLQPKMIFTYGVSWPQVSQLTILHECVRRIVEIGFKEAGSGDCLRLSYGDFLDDAKNADEDDVDLAIRVNMANDSVLVYLHTSGSTSGKPKVLPFTNRAIYASLIYASNSTGTKTRDQTVNRVLCIPPYQHGYGWMTIFVNLMGGNQVVLAPGASEEAIGEYYKYKTSYIYGSPLIFRMFMERTPKDADLSFLTAFFCAGFSVPEEQFKEAAEFFAAHNSHAEIRNNYGISEGLCIGTASDGIEHRPGTSGKFYVGPEWLIVDDNLDEVKYGEVGELIVHSETLCQGYFGDPNATKEAFIWIGDKMFYQTGDYVSLSEDGYVSFLGRKKRFFQPLGVADKVNCETIEHALDAVEIVEQAAVIVKRDRKGIEGARAYVSLRSDEAAKIALPLERSEAPIDGVPKIVYETICTVISDEIAKTLLPFQMPREIVILHHIPMMRSGKVDYQKLEQM